jgi:hypothetical protein
MYTYFKDKIVPLRMYKQRNINLRGILLLFPRYGSTAPWGPRPPHYLGFTITLRHTTVGRTPLDE